MLDSGVREGPDVAAALASGAKFAFMGRSFMYGVGALGKTGGDLRHHRHMATLRSDLADASQRETINLVARDSRALLQRIDQRRAETVRGLRRQTTFGLGGASWGADCVGDIDFHEWLHCLDTARCARPGSPASTARFGKACRIKLVCLQ